MKDTNLLNRTEQFLSDNPRMSIIPHTDLGICIKGKFNFVAFIQGYKEIEDTYNLKITVPAQFPRDIPTVKEIDKKIPHRKEFHINGDGSLCLGSPLRLLKKISDTPTLSGFTEKCLVPYLYAVSYKLQNGGNLLFGELAHGKNGIIDDYSYLLGLPSCEQVQQAIQLLGIKKRLANKKPCPCGCGKRLGACPFHLKLNAFRKMAPASWFKEHSIYTMIS